MVFRTRSFELKYAGSPSLVSDVRVEKGKIDFTTKKAYDLCEVPRYDIDPNHIEYGKWDYKYGEYVVAAYDYWDHCQGSDRTNMPCFKEGTSWTNLWVASAIILMLSLVNFALLILGTWFFIPRVLGTFLNGITGCFFLIGVSLSILFNQLPAATDYCRYNIAPVDYLGNF